MNTAESRHWTVHLEVDPQGKVDARVTAGGKTLLPSLTGETSEEALHYVEGALVDVLPGDSVEATVACPVASSQRYTVASAAIALMWVSETLLKATRLTRMALGSAFDAGPTSETRIRAVSPELLPAKLRSTR